MKIYLAIIAVVLITLAIPGYRYMSDYQLETRLEEYGCNVSFQNDAMDRYFLGEQQIITVYVFNNARCYTSLKTNDFIETLANCKVERILICIEEENFHLKPNEFDLEAALREKSFVVEIAPTD